MRETPLTCSSEARSLPCGWRCGSGMWRQEGRGQVLQEHLLRPGRSRDTRRAPAQHPSVHVPRRGRLGCRAPRPPRYGGLGFRLSSGPVSLYVLLDPKGHDLNRSWVHPAPPNSLASQGIQKIQLRTVPSLPERPLSRRRGPRPYLVTVISPSGVSPPQPSEPPQPHGLLL